MTTDPRGPASVVVTELVAWMERYGGVTPEGEDAQVLIDGARRALRAALSGGARERETAYALLAADGLITSAVERLAEGPDPAEAFRVLLDRVAQSANGGSA